MEYFEYHLKWLYANFISRSQSQSCTAWRPKQTGSLHAARQLCISCLTSLNVALQPVDKKQNAQSAWRDSTAALATLRPL